MRELLTTEERLAKLERDQPEPEPLALDLNKPPVVCMRPGCGRKIWCRGLCQLDYRIARLAIKQKAVTWRMLENAGRSWPAKGGTESINRRYQFFRAVRERARENDPKVIARRVRMFKNFRQRRRDGR